MTETSAKPYGRDWELIKLIFQKIDISNNPREIKFDDSINQVQLFEHVLMLKEAGLIEAAISKSGYGGGGYFTLLRIPMEGHDFYEKIKNETMWRKMKTVAKEKGIELSIDAIGQLFSYCMKQVLS